MNMSGHCIDSTEPPWDNRSSLPITFATVNYILCASIGTPRVKQKHILQDRVKNPRNTKFVHQIDPHDVAATTQKSISLMVDIVTPNSADSSNTTTLLAPNKHHMVHSRSSPLLQGVWSMRKLENAIPPLDTKLSCKLRGYPLKCLTY